MLITETQRLTLRCLTLTDAEFYLNLLNDPLWIKNIGDKGVHTIEAAREAIVSKHLAVQEKMGFSIYLVERTSDHAAIGLCGLVRREQLDEIDIGYGFLPEYRGQGYASEAVESMIDFAKEKLKLSRLLAIVSPHNLASSNLLKKQGFNFKEILHWQDKEAIELYELLFKLVLVRV